MTKADRNLLDYIVVCISEFANRYEMHMRDAYVYLNRYKGIEFLKEFYDVDVIVKQDIKCPIEKISVNITKEYKDFLEEDEKVLSIKK